MTDFNKHMEAVIRGKSPRSQRMDAIVTACPSDTFTSDLYDVELRMKWGVCVRVSEEGIPRAKENAVRRLKHELYSDIIPKLYDLFDVIGEEDYQKGMDKVAELIDYIKN